LKRFLYRLSEEELSEALAHKPVALEVLQREGETLTVASYEPLAGLEPISTEEVGEDWKNWKQNFGPVEVKDFVIMPPWKRPVLINPGTAFGTGLHPTTQMCIELLSEYVREGDSVLDVGTGSGILAIVSKLLGAGRVLGIDISKDALRACEENAKLNGVKVETSLETPSEIEEPFDVVVANLEMSIFRKELKHLLPLYKRVAIFSGIYGEDELEQFLKLAGTPADYRVVSREDWYCIIVNR